jgi:hypothetical protein
MFASGFPEEISLSNLIKCFTDKIQGSDLIVFREKIEDDGQDLGMRISVEITSNGRHS